MTEPTTRARGVQLGAFVRKHGVDRGRSLWVGVILLTVIVGLCIVVPVVWPDPVEP